MPLDTRIPLLGRGVEIPQIDLGQTLAQVANLKQANQQLTLGELGLAKAKREQAHEAAVAEALRAGITTNGQLDYPGLAGRFAAEGNQRGLMLLRDLQKADLERQQTQADIGLKQADTAVKRAEVGIKGAEVGAKQAQARKAEVETLAHVNTLIYQAASSVVDQATYDRAIEYLDQTLLEPYRTRILSETPAIYDPAYVQQIQQMTRASSEALQQQLKELEVGNRDVKAKEAQQLKTEEQLRGELQKLGTDFRSQAEAYGRVQASSQDDSPAADLSLIFSYMKILDPGSTVREGEQATARNAVGIPDRIRGLYNRLMTGESLLPNQRADFVRQAQRLYQQAERDYVKKEHEYTGLAQRLGARPENVKVDVRSTAEPAVTASTPRAPAPVVKSPYGHLRPEQLTPQQRAEEKAWLQQQLSGGR